MNRTVYKSELSDFNSNSKYSMYCTYMTEKISMNEKTRLSQVMNVDNDSVVIKRILIFPQTYNLLKFQTLQSFSALVFIFLHIPTYFLFFHIIKEFHSHITSMSEEQKIVLYYK